MSRACAELGATRQTVRRHINALETLLGDRLFDVVDRQYQITTFGQASLDEACALLLRLDIWTGQSALKKNTSHGLERLEYTDAQGEISHSQQHPVSQIASHGLPIIKQAFIAWGTAQSQIEHDAMDAIRPYIVLYRKEPTGWVFVDVGEESAYARWFGWKWSRSAIGKLLEDGGVGDAYSAFVAGAYGRVYHEGGVRLDHIMARLPKDDGAPVASTFQRLLLGCVFPDGTPGLILLAVLTEQVEIAALNEAERPKMPSDLIMDQLPHGDE